MKHYSYIFEEIEKLNKQIEELAIKQVELASEREKLQFHAELLISYFENSNRE